MPMPLFNGYFLILSFGLFIMSYQIIITVMIVLSCLKYLIDLYSFRYSGIVIDWF